MPRPSARQKFFEIEGKRFSTVNEIAKHYGKTPAAVYKRIYNGTLHLIGLPRKQRYRIGDVDYLGQEAAAAGVGVTLGVFKRALANGTVERCGLAKAKGKRPNGRRDIIATHPARSAESC